ncbi:MULTISPECIES: NADP-dependent oxidoreductase [unclassified Microbacterium]|uniref:NADP-dependent oxidoreductase n=1 Tax=unclassified Microbacterium TaxID=2609290 RepID=UPI00214BA87F|nr:MULTISPECIES: NADP-dependent oxidoreductase [unclassified Microbacterium]MCR2808399.1 NADP-dependent oxidoreductase [Microbacterium sp. zg.B185]WIM19155.1 NADP-dependent oxidoreductase [Microbacterium sp. zg-B185]
MSRFAQYAELGGPEVIHVAEGEVPVPDPGWVLVEVRAHGVNPFDTKVRSGARAAAPEAPRGVGHDGAGVITAIGDGVTDWAVADEVIFGWTQGAAATHALVRPMHLTRKLPEVSWETGAALPIPVGTAYQALKSLGVTDGDRILIHAGSGSVGQAAIQFARLWGAEVVATGSPRSFDRIRELGATPVGYGDGLLERLRDSASAGFTVILDLAGTDEALDSIALVDPARFASAAAGLKADARGITAYGGGSAVPLTGEQRAQRAEAVAVVQPLIAAGEFSVEIGLVIPLDEIVDAHRASESNRVRGKIIIIP